MDYNLEDFVDDRLWVNISLVAPPQHETSLSQLHGEPVPQSGYKRGTGRSPSANEKGGIVPFFLEDGTYLRVSMALAKDYTGLVCHNDPALPYVGQTVTVRFEWPGYPSKAYQLRTIDWCTPPNKIPVSKLATEVSKLVETFIKDMEGKPIDPEHARWKVGTGGIQTEHLRLAAFEQASTGSWQARLFYKR